MSDLSTLPKGDSAWLFRKAVERIMQQVSVLETNIGSSTTGNSSNTQVIFNDNGTLRGDPDLIFNAAINRLVATNLESTAALTVGTSATITGDLTVASSILKVSGGNVGINTASPTNTAGYKTLEIVGTGVNTGGMIRMKSSDASVNSYDFVDNNGRGIFAVSNHNLRFGCNDIEQYRIQPLGIFTWYDGAGGTRMTLNSTGLGVGVVPAVKGHFYSASGSNELRLENGATGAGSTNRLSFKNASGAADARTGAIEWYDVATFKGDIRLLKAGGIQIRNSADSPTFNLDDTGNVGVGVTPRAWATGYRALNVGIYTALTDAQGGATYLTNNAYYDTTDSRWEAVTNNRALRYDQDTADGGHKWYSAPSVAANAALVWSTPMVLDANGNLIWSPATTAPTLATNGQLTVNATSNTNLRFSYRGSDGTTRVANITLA